MPQQQPGSPCVDCGVPVSTHQYRCPPCKAEKHRQAKATYYRQRSATVRLCGDCQSEPLFPRHRFCSPCAKKRLAESSRRSNHARYWDKSEAERRALNHARYVNWRNRRSQSPPTPLDEQARVYAAAWLGRSA